MLAKKPTSSYATAARFGLAEMLFQEAPADASKWDQAAAFYKEAAKAPPPGNLLYGYAHYRLGQVFARTGNSQSSIREFQKVLAFTKQFPDAPYAAMLTAAARDAMPTR